MQLGAFSISLTVKDIEASRAIYEKFGFKEQGVQLVTGAYEGTTGPASFIAVDPDGNPILVDQHV
jgi:hypothetical protein